MAAASFAPSTYVRHWSFVFGARLVPIVAAFIASLIVVLAVWFVDSGEQDRARRQHRAEVRHTASEARAKLE
ncbi:MAG TPA: hypothetical protein VNM48_20715, partial [Chloroflexota bacterium]|nr:hypothetical protein [Chloroflexota bacterium]